MTALVIFVSISLLLKLVRIKQIIMKNRKEEYKIMKKKKKQGKKYITKKRSDKNEIQ
jgi:hypothetical protein